MISDNRAESPVSKHEHVEIKNDGKRKIKKTER